MLKTSSPSNSTKFGIRPHILSPLSRIRGKSHLKQSESYPFPFSFFAALREKFRIRRPQGGLALPLLGDHFAFELEPLRKAL